MTPYRMAEIIIYALVNCLPLISLALYPFWNRLRFSKRVTFCGIFVLCLIRFVLTYSMSIAERRGGLVLFGTALYALFFFIFIKDKIGKGLFLLLLLSNISNLILTAAKVSERFLFPTLYTTPYRWSSSLTFLFMEALILIPLFFYIKHFFFRTFVEDNRHWNFLWLIPLTFYSVWFRNFYFGAEGSKELAQRPQYLLFSLVINGGALLVYTIVAQLILQYAENIKLIEKSHQLTLQHAMYGNIQDRIEEARHAKHDMKQHIHVVAAYLQEKKYDELEKYLQRYQKSMTNDVPLFFCEHSAINALLQYFAGYAKIINTGFSAAVALPNDVGIPDEELVVTLGNLLENAIEACVLQETPTSVISVKGKVDKGSVFFKVVNTCLAPPETDSEGVFLSSKRAGRGIGLRSVKNITQKYNGVMKAHWENGMFITSVLLNIPRN